jgi:hypothetical protein
MKIELIDVGFFINDIVWARSVDYLMVAIEETLLKEIDLSFGSLLEVLRWEIEAAFYLLE